MAASRLICYSDPVDHYSHRVRLVLAEKGVEVDVQDVRPDAFPARLAELNPYAGLPILAERELALYEPSVILEYLEERYPHPALMPAYPLARANTRLLMYRIQRDWCAVADRALDPRSAPQARAQACKELRESLTGVSALFAEKPFFLSDELSLVDCCLLPVLWRLPLLGIELPRAAKPLLDYMERSFARPAFQASLSDAERKMR